MKKLLSSIILLSILAVIIWALSGWMLAAEAERAFKDIIQENSTIKGEKLLRFNLLDYHKTFSGANAKLRVSSDIPFVNERMGEFDLNVQLQNGPVFFTKSGVSVGSSRWLLQIDENSLSVAERENLKHYFPTSLPKALVRLDFKNNAHYLMKIKSSITQVLVTGLYNLETQDNRGAITLDNFQLDVSSSQLQAKKVAISYQHQKALSAAYKPGTTSLQIPSLQIKLPKLKKSIDLNLTAKSNISINNHYLSGFIKTDIKIPSPTEIPIDSAKISLLFKGISADGFINFSEAHADLDNLKQQAKWLLEENGEFPEGQDQIWQLYDQIAASSQKLPELLINKLLSSESLIQFKAESNYQKGISEASGEIKSIKTGGGVSLKTLENTNRSTTLLSTLLSVLQGDASVKLDDKLFVLITKLTPINKQKFKLSWKENKLSLIPR